ncbi:hypothetical protein B0I29_11270 [Actinoplanes lutulentus]|uniref:Ferritin-like protein n=2 Tax=Actinoplanes lutulentus TaxID=1287878 RepID=A0A327ZCR0_9ACTN|nr:hypothetical protein B0I29_11270 [Actinoplanes lutulentus]
MVLTGPVRMSDSVHTRRRILTATGAIVAAATLAGCGLFDDEPEPEPAPDPLQPILDEALAMAAAYDLAIQAQATLAEQLTPLAEDHRAHAAALATLIGTVLPSGAAAPVASAAPPAGSADETLAQLRKSEQDAQTTAIAACLAAPADRAALVGSIAACRATHASALR